jgi:hypothetical protein
MTKVKQTLQQPDTPTNTLPAVAGNINVSILTERIKSNQKKQ